LISAVPVSRTRFRFEDRRCGRA